MSENPDPQLARRGRFITLEGGEGVGKTKQVALLVEALSIQGIPIIGTREPGGAPGSEALRRLLLEGDIDWSPAAETLIHFAARAEHLSRTIAPALNDGTWVVCDRFYDSTLAYQGYGQGADRAFIQAQIDLLNVAPDLTLVLDAPEGIAAERRRSRGCDDRYERMDTAFHERVRKGFRAIAAEYPWRCVLVDASGSIGAVHTSIMRIIQREGYLNV